MPIYEYICDENHMYTEERSIHEVEAVPSCGICNRELRRIYTPATISFKGPGFYSSR